MPVLIFTWFDIEKTVLFNSEFLIGTFLSDVRLPEVDFFSHLSGDYEQIFGQIVALRVKTLSHTNLVASRQIKG